jgi:cell division septation protein DedD
VNVTLLVPARDPEQSSTDADLPTLSMVRPDGSTELFTATERVRFDESFSGTSYVRLVEVAEPAQAGEYALTVTAAVPARFTVAVGTDERFGTPVENVVDRAGASKGIAAWYATPPPIAAAPVTTTSTSVAPTTTTPDTTTPATTTPDTTVGDAAVTTAVPQTGGVDGAAGSAVFIGAIAVVLAGAGFLVWSKRRNTPA